MSVLREPPRTLHPFAMGLLLRAHLVEAVEALSIELGKLRLRIEGIDVRYAAGHETENHVLHLGREVQFPGRDIRVRRIGHERGERHETEAV